LGVIDDRAILVAREKEVLRVLDLVRILARTGEHCCVEPLLKIGTDTRSVAILDGDSRAGQHRYACDCEENAEISTLVIGETAGQRGKPRSKSLKFNECPPARP